ncbi:transposase DNA-binding domain family [Lyngbya aestuarii BL J]|uniref:Transposase DNA-binding domain family n=1 Tax=Lyngbya aestuarii BL J TaxID=1348334 RepID=U7QML5_9CYAN|nr:transposase DNA-binding domain family [Lyngbya aestuarii BL J]
MQLIRLILLKIARIAEQLLKNLYQLEPTFVAADASWIGIITPQLIFSIPL